MSRVSLSLVQAMTAAQVADRAWYVAIRAGVVGLLHHLGSVVSDDIASSTLHQSNQAP